MANDGEKKSTIVRRTTVNLTNRGDTAVDRIKGHLGTTNETDAVNRGLDLAAQVLDMLESGGTFRDASGTEVKFIIV